MLCPTCKLPVLFLVGGQHVGCKGAPVVAVDVSERSAKHSAYLNRGSRRKIGSEIEFDCIRRRKKESR